MALSFTPDEINPWTEYGREVYRGIEQEMIRRETMTPGENTERYMGMHCHYAKNRTTGKLHLVAYNSKNKRVPGSREAIIDLEEFCKHPSGITKERVVWCLAQCGIDLDLPTF